MDLAESKNIDYFSFVPAEKYFIFIYISQSPKDNDDITVGIRSTPGECFGTGSDNVVPL